MVAFLHREPDLKPKSCIWTYSIFSQVIFYGGSSNAEQRSIVPESCIFKCDSPCSTLVVLPLSSSPPGSFLLTALTCAVDAYMLLYRALFANCWRHYFGTILALMVPLCRGCIYCPVVLKQCLLLLLLPPNCPFLSDCEYVCVSSKATMVEWKYSIKKCHLAHSPIVIPRLWCPVLHPVCDKYTFPVFLDSW